MQRQEDIPKVRVEVGGRRAEDTGPWWRAQNAAPALTNVLNELRIQQASRLADANMMARLYSGRPIGNVYHMGAANRRSYILSPDGNSALSWNIAQSCVQTVAAKLAKNRPRPRFDSFGADYEVWERCENLTKFIDGLNYGNDSYALGEQVFIDGCVFPAGAFKVTMDPEYGEIGEERCIPTEIWVDDVDGMYGDPLTLYHTPWVHREALIDRYARGPRAAEIRARLMDVAGGDPMGLGRTTDMIEVTEAWKRARRMGGDDGLHVISVADVELAREPWPFDFFPFPRYVWERGLSGWWGVSLVEQLIPLQIELNRVLEVIVDSQQANGVGKWVVDTNAQVNVKGGMTNDPREMMMWTSGGTAQPPQLVTVSAVAPELYNWAERIYSRAFELTGVSMLSAAARKPEGLDAAVALREYQDIESERFVLKGMGYERMFLEKARMQLAFARHMFTNGGKSVKVRAPGTDLVEEIEWSKIDLREDQYLMRMTPSSILPTQPQAKLQKVQELYEAGMPGFDKDNVLMMLDMPDVDAHTNIALAGLKDAHRTVDALAKGGRYEPPEPEQNLGAIIKLAQSTILRGRKRGLPGERIERLQRLMEDARQELERATQTPTAPAAQAAEMAATQQQGAGMPGGGQPPVGMQGQVSAVAGVPALPSQLQA